MYNTYEKFNDFLIIIDVVTTSQGCANKFALAAKLAPAAVGATNF